MTRMCLGAGDKREIMTKRKKMIERKCRRSRFPVLNAVAKSL